MTLRKALEDAQAAISTLPSDIFGVASDDASQWPIRDELLAKIDAALSPDDPPSVEREKIAPVQGYSAGIPWAMHLRAYDAYCKKYGAQKALIDLEGRGCRGGFGVGELDMFIPGWREELSELHQLRRRVADLEREKMAIPPAAKVDAGVREALVAAKQFIYGLRDYSDCLDLYEGVGGPKIMKVIDAALASHPLVSVGQKRLNSESEHQTEQVGHVLSPEWYAINTAPADGPDYPIQICGGGFRGTSVAHWTGLATLF